MAAAVKRRQVSGANWGSSADNWMGGDVKKWGGSSGAPAQAGKERQNSQRRTSRQFWPGMSSGSKRDTQTSAQGPAADPSAAGKS